ncbi:MAG: NAD(P)/FAD-dependent oxidoreductase [Gemmatimonadales bacterium]
MTDPVVVIGAGLAGLSAGRRLAAAEIPFLLLEGADRPGGRVATDRIAGFQLDRGFQVLLTAYPEARRQLDYPALDLHSFRNGARIHVGGKVRSVVDPRAHPFQAIRDLSWDLVTVGDLPRLARLRWGGDGDAPAPAHSTAADWRQLGFSDRLQRRFLGPFFGGVMLDPDLATDCRVFRFTFAMFAAGSATLPRDGMGAIPAQLAGTLPSGSIRYRAPVRAVRLSGRAVTLASGEEIAARAVVVATDGTAAARLLGPRHATAPGWRGTTTLYYAAERSPIDEPILHLEGDRQGPVNHLAVPSDVAPSYAPPGGSLIAANLLTAERPVATLDVEAREQLGRWFGAAVGRWHLLAAYQLPNALPAQPPDQRPVPGGERIEPGVYRCGDYLDIPSINGALASGRRAAEAVIEDFGRPNGDGADQGPARPGALGGFAASTGGAFEYPGRVVEAIARRLPA